MSDYRRNTHFEQVGEGKVERRLGKTAAWVEREGGDRVLILHNTPIVTVRADDGAIVLDSGGWKTITTKKYMNEALGDEGLRGWSVYQQSSMWYLHKWMGENKDSYTFKDGITILPDGTVVGASMATAKQSRNLVSMINKYANEFVKALFGGRIEAPGGGDCWYCSFTVVDSDKTWGEASGSDHILDHIKTGYYVPSLLLRAIERYPISRWAEGVLWTLWGENTGLAIEDARKRMGGIASDQIKSSLRRYVRQQLGLPPL